MSKAISISFSSHCNERDKIKLTWWSIAHVHRLTTNFNNRQRWIKVVCSACLYLRYARRLTFIPKYSMDFLYLDQAFYYSLDAYPCHNEASGPHASKFYSRGLRYFMYNTLPPRFSKKLIVCRTYFKFNLCWILETPASRGCIPIGTNLVYG